jgi:hypothetical protein
MKKMLFMIGSDQNNPEDWNLNYQSDDGQFVLVSGPDDTIDAIAASRNKYDTINVNVPDILNVEQYIVDKMQERYPDCTFEMLTASTIEHTADESLDSENYE